VSCQLQIYDHYIQNYDTLAYINSSSGWKVGYNGPAGCKLSTQRPAGVYGVTTGGQVTASGSVTWSVSVAGSISYGPLDLSTQLTYSPPSYVSAGSFVPGSNQTTMTSYLPSNDYLEDVGQYYANSFQLVRAAYGSGQSVPCGMVFIYNLYNYGASLQGGNPTPYGNPQRDVWTWSPYVY